MLPGSKETGIKVPANDSLERLDQDMAKKSLDGFWRVRLSVPPEPTTTVKPFLWPWEDVYTSLVRAGKLVSPEDCDRRVVRLVNPGIEDRRGITSHTIQLGLQSVNPGEHAASHRHMVVALRFVVKGAGAFTTIEGQKCVMAEGDLILNPRFCWHDHTNHGSEPVVWLDGLDTPLVALLQQKAFQVSPDPIQQVDIESDQVTPLFGLARSGFSVKHKLIHYKWKDTFPALKALQASAEGASPFDGYLLEYRNPVTTGPTLPSIQCAIQLLEPSRKTDAHRHTSTTIYHAFSGTGTTFIGSQPFDWKKGDSFVVPLWYPHYHINRSDSEDAILFSMSDAPILKALELYREEPVVP
jgi:gentisate 1,2-dioxygenase